MMWRPPAATPLALLRASGFEVRLPVQELGVLAIVPALGERQVLGVAAEQDVGAAAGHVGGDRDRALGAGLRDDLGLALVLLGVQHVVLDAGTLELRREHLGGLDRDRADEDRLTLRVALLDLLDHRVELLALGLVDHVGRGRRAPSDGWSGSPARRGRRSSRTRGPRCRPCRSCPRSCRTCGSSSGR